MITAIEIENFKGIGRPVRVDVRPITLLFGPNSSGKSTILHAIHYANEILTRRNVDPDRTQHGGDSVDLGGFRTFVHRKDSGDALDSQRIRLRFELDLSGVGPVTLSPYLRDHGDEQDTRYVEWLSDNLETGWVEIGVQWSSVRSEPIVVAYEVGLNNSPVAWIEATPDGSNVDLRRYEILHPLLEYWDEFEEEQRPEPKAELIEGDEGRLVGAVVKTLRVGVLNLGRSSLPRWEEPLEYDTSEDAAEDAFETTILSRISGILVGLGRLLRDELGEMRYLGPLRDVLPRIYAAPRFAEPARWASGQAAWDLLLHRGVNFVEQVGAWLARDDRLGSGYGLRLQSFRELAEESALMASIRRGTVLDDYDDLAAEIGSLSVRTDLKVVDSTTGLAVHPSDVGVGISQVLPVVVAALDPDRPQLTAIEQPELHIHPRLQVELGDLFASQTVNESGVFLLETHSEHLLLRLQRRILETSSGRLPAGAPSLRPEDLSVCYIQQREGEVRATPLRVDGKGDFIDSWPEGFFEESLKEMFPKE